MKLFDAHCHLQDERLSSVLEPAMSAAAAAGVAGMVCCGSSESDWPAVRKIATQFGGVIPCFGLHPWYIAQRSPRWLETLREYLRTTSAAVGEIGLDPALERRDDAAQEAVFTAQLELCREANLPASIHCRRAWGRMLEILSRFGAHAPGWVIHSFSGAPDLIPPLAALNVYFSFSGAITRSGNTRGRRSLCAVPADRLLIETDAPDLPPVIRHNGSAATPVIPEINEPVNLVYVARQAAEWRQIDLAELARVTWENGMRVYGAI